MILGIQLFRIFRIDFAEHLPDGHIPFRKPDLLQLTAILPIGHNLGDVEVEGDRIDVEPGAPAEDRNLSLIVESRDDPFGSRLVLPDRIILPDIDDIEQMMRDSIHLFLSDLAGADIKPSVDLP